ncbi:MAG: carboxypeptidase regulatory-like domain-containing protein [Coleofasciculaceae cyanobacterium]
MLEISLSNPQVAIAGRVLEGETEKAISGAMVEIIAMPDKFQTILSLKALQYGWQWSKMRERCDRKITTSDGYFHFVKLPPGEYILEASLPGRGTRYNSVQKTVKVADSIKGKISTVVADIVLLPTGIKGTVTDADEPNKAIVNAKVQIQGSRDWILTDQEGNYRLLGLESSKSGQRTVNLIISATGYQQVSLSVVIKHGVVISNQNFSLKQQ